MPCLYTNGTKSFNSTEIIKEFYKAKHKIKNWEIFSQEELQKNTVDRILKISSINDYQSSKNTPVLEFVTKENPLFKTITGLENQTRLAPEYIKEEYISNYVKEQLRTDKFPNLLENIQEVNDMFLKIKDKLPSDRPGESKYLINEALKELEIAEYTKDFGILLHKLISLKLNGKSYESDLNSFVNDPNNKILFSEDKLDEWKLRIESIINQIHDQVLNNGYPISEIFLVYNDSDNPRHKFAVKGKIDLVVVDSRGTPNIFEIKVSKSSYKSKRWGRAKLLTLDWQLALYKQLLSQHEIVDNINLNVLPIIIGDSNNPESLIFEGVFNRSVENPQLSGGKIETVANSIIPRKIHGEYDPEKLSEFKDKLHRLFGKDYSVNLRSKEFTLDEMIKKSTNLQKRDGGEFKSFNAYHSIPGLERGYITASTIEELIPKMELYIKHENDNKDKKIVELKDAIKTAIVNKQKLTTSNSDHDIQVNRLLLSYLSDSWEVIDDFPEVYELGLILLRNKNTGNVNVLSLSANDFLQDSKIEGFNEGDIEYAKTLLFLNEYKKLLLPYSTNKIGEIIIFNPEKFTHYYRTTHSEFNKFYNLMNKMEFSDSEIKLSLENDFLNIVNIAMTNLDDYYRLFTEAEREGLSGIMDILNNPDINLKKLIEAQKAFYSINDEYKLKTFDSTLNYNDKKEVLLALLNTAILSYNNTDLGGDIQGLSRFGFTFADLGDTFRSILSNSRPKYNKENKRITGLFQSLDWTTPDWNPSKDLRNINKIVSGANSTIREWLLRESESLNKRTLKYYDDIGFTESERFLVGETQSKYRDLWKGDGNSLEFITKNPYKDDIENALRDEVRRDYLKDILFRINIYKLNLNLDDVKDLNPRSLESISKNQTIADAISSGAYFEMPLVKREEMSKEKAVFKTAGQKTLEVINKYGKEKSLDFLDNRELTTDDVKAQELSKMGFYEMYDSYGKHTPEFKSVMVEKLGIDHFEFNLDTIAHRLIFNKIRKTVYDQIFPVLNAYVWWIKMLGGKSNEDVSNVLEHIHNQLKLSAFGQHIIDDEFKDLTVAQAWIKRVSTIGMLAFRPILMIKELTIGTFKAASLAATKLYGKDQFTIEDLRKAYGKLLTIDKKFSQEFNLIDRLNQFYGIANMDMNTASMKMQTDRHGVVMRGLGRYMFLSNTFGDYYNRMVLFLAKMIHDGSYDAHEYKDDKLVYNPKKDKRFEYYFNNREKYKVGENYTASESDTVYNEQRRSYLLLLNQLNSQYGAFGQTLTEKDLATKAYSETERSSIKSFIDMAFGYYDKDAQSQSNNMWYGMTWMMFMQYWPAKIKTWFGHPTEKNASDSAYGSVRQDYTMRNGKKILKWYKTEITEDGRETKQETEENTGDPVMVWSGTYFEGLAHSVLSTTRDLVKCDFDKITDDKERLGRVTFAITDGILMLIMFSLFASLFQAYKKENGTEGMSRELIDFGEAISKKVAAEQNMFMNTFGALNSEPAWLSWSRRVAVNFGDVLEGNKTILDAASRNIGALEPFRSE